MSQTWYIVNEDDGYNAVIILSGFPYADIHQAAAGSTITIATNSQNLYPVGHIKNDGGSFTIGRAGIEFNTTTYINALTPTAAYFLLWDVTPLRGTLCVVDAIGLSDPITLGDYHLLYLADVSLGDSDPVVTDHGFLSIDIGTSAIDPDNYTYLGLRHEQEIAANPPTNPPPTETEYFEIPSKTGDDISSIFHLSATPGYNTATLTLNINGTGAAANTPLILKVVVSEGSGEVYSNIDARFFYYRNDHPEEIIYSPWQNNIPFFEDIDYGIMGLLPLQGYTYGTEWRYSNTETTFTVDSTFTTVTVMMVSGLRHVYNKRQRVYNLEITFGGVTTTEPIVETELQTVAEKAVKIPGSWQDETGKWWYPSPNGLTYQDKPATFTPVKTNWHPPQTWPPKPKTGWHPPEVWPPSEKL
jgi:hypothetical protein